MTKFDYDDYSKEFEIELTRFIPISKKDNCGDDEIRYALLIGKTDVKRFDGKVTVLSHCDYEHYDIGSKLKISPTPNPINNSARRPIAYMMDTIIEGKNRWWAIGSENKAVWGKPIRLNK